MSEYETKHPLGLMASKKVSKDTPFFSILIAHNPKAISSRTSPILSIGSFLKYACTWNLSCSWKNLSAPLFFCRCATPVNKGTFFSTYFLNFPTSKVSRNKNNSLTLFYPSSEFSSPLMLTTIPSHDFGTEMKSMRFWVKNKYVFLK